MRRIANWLRSVPHLFGKVMVVWCVACGSACCVYALRILSHTGQDPAALLGVILAFFGGELGLMFGRDALRGKKNRDGSLSYAVPGDVSDSDTEL